MISQKLSMKLEPCNSTQGAPFQYIINIKLYLYLGSFCSSVRGIIIQTKTLIAQSIEFSFRLLFAWVIKVIVKLSQWNLPHIQSNVDVKLSIFFFFENLICWTANKVQRTWLLQPNTFSVEKGVYCKPPSLCQSAPVSDLESEDPCQAKCLPRISFLLIKWKRLYKFYIVFFFCIWSNVR